MKTPTNTPTLPWSLVTIGFALLISLLLWFKFVNGSENEISLPSVSSYEGEQLELPLNDGNDQPAPGSEAPTPLVKKRFDEGRQGTCIIYALIAPAAGEYLIPGCYGKPDHWRLVSEGKILKIGRHWNPQIRGCGSIDRLIGAVLNTRYASDKKFPNGKIKYRWDSPEILQRLEVRVLECLEGVTEHVCEATEKKYIRAAGGSKKLLLNCCCR